MNLSPRNKKRLLLGILLLLAGFFFFKLNKATAPKPAEQTKLASSIPLEKALERITKKPFGTQISKATSPVQPERFSGFHTGADFETFADEQDKEMEVRAICEGKVLLKKQASGYGGLAIQECELKNQAVTAIYGHLKFTSIKSEGVLLKAGDVLGILGKGYSSETDGERKHLHLAVHKGVSVNILGYVQKQEDLKNWLDPLEFLK